MGVLKAKVGGIWVPVGSPMGFFGVESAKPVTPASPIQYFATDTKRNWQWDGTGWIILSEPQQTYAPSPTNVSNGGGFSLSGWYHRSDGYCDVHIYHMLGNSTAGVITSPGPAYLLPFTSSNLGDEQYVFEGSAALYDATGPIFGLMPVIIGNSRVEPRYLAISGSTSSPLGQISNTFPITISVSDTIAIRLRYRMLSRYS